MVPHGLHGDCTRIDCIGPVPTPNALNIQGMFSDCWNPAKNKLDRFNERTRSYNLPGSKTSAVKMLISAQVNLEGKSRFQMW